MRSQLIVGCLTVVGLAGPLTAGAVTTTSPDGDAVLSRVVRYSDLNLESREGVRRLYSRIKSAAEEVCVPVYFRITASNGSQRHCQERAIDEAVAAVRSDSLTALHLAVDGGR
jgi:UrcA family protein